MTLEAGTKLGRYEVVKHLARGGMADLSIARTTGIEGFERHVVLKHLRPEQAGDTVFVQMFTAEARLAASLHHNNIVQVHDIGEDQGRHFFAMEYVHGEDVRCLLAKLHQRREHTPLGHALTIVTSAAAALHYAHEQKGPDRKPLDVVHRDVTPGNILVGYDGTVKVVDFGIAKAAMRRVETTVGMLKGKVPYMSPEQCTGKPLDRRSDVFSLGIVLYELLTVKRLFKGGNEFVTMRAITQGEIPSPSLRRSDIPPALEAILMKALARLPADRYQTAEELREALDELAVQAGIRTSTTALASYMKELFGERPEPWFTDEPAPRSPTDGGRVPAGSSGSFDAFNTPSGPALRSDLEVVPVADPPEPEAPSVEVFGEAPPRRFDRRWLFAGAAALGIVIFGVAVAMRGGDDQAAPIVTSDPPPADLDPARPAVGMPTPPKQDPTPEGTTKPTPTPEGATERAKPATGGPPVPSPGARLDPTPPPDPGSPAVAKPGTKPAPARPDPSVKPAKPTGKPAKPPPKWDPNVLLP